VARDNRMDKTELKIRHAKGEDLAVLQQLFIDTISVVCSKDYTTEQISVWTSSIKKTQRWLDMIENQFFLLVEIGDKIVGFGSLENGDHVDMLYVHKDFQRQGIADLLYSHLEKEAINQNKTILTSNVSKTARRFFEKKGFIIISKQTKIRKGVEISNYKMAKELRTE
jgi:putative acetyltransferase